MKTKPQKKGKGFPYEYGDKKANEIRLSDHAVTFLSDEAVQERLASTLMIIFAVANCSQPANAVQFGEISGQIQGGPPSTGANYCPPARSNGIPPGVGLGAPAPGPGGGGGAPSNPPVFYIPGKPKTTSARAVNTVAFTTAVGLICLNGVWGQAVAMAMCVTGLVGVSLSLSKQMTIHIVRLFGLGGV